MIASARMSSWSPSLAAAWHRLLAWVAARAGVALEVMDQADPMPLDELWRREDLGCGVAVFVGDRIVDIRTANVQQHGMVCARGGLHR